jgi:hypothetical protein
MLCGVAVLSVGVLSAGVLVAVMACSPGQVVARTRAPPGPRNRSGGRGRLPIPRRGLGALGAVEVVEDAASSSGDRRGGGADDGGVPGRPCGDVGDGVGAGVQTGPGGDDVGDRLGLGLGPATAAPVVEALGGVPALDVRQFVGEGLDRLGVGDVRADPHGAGGRVGEAVGLPAVLADERVAVRGDLAGQRLPQGGGGVTGQQLGCDLGQRVALGLGDVEDVRDPKPAQHPRRPGRLVGVPAGRLPRRPRRCRGGGRGWTGVLSGAGVGSVGGVRAGSQHREPGGPLDHAAAQRLPRAEPGDPGRADAQPRSLQPDQQLVVQAVGVELRGRVEHRPPLRIGGQRLDALADLLVQGGDLRRPGGVGCFPLRRSQLRPPTPASPAGPTAARAAARAAGCGAGCGAGAGHLDPPGTGADAGTGGAAEQVSCHPFPRPVRHRALLRGRERRRGTTGPRLLPQRSARRAEGSWSGREETAREAPTLSCRTGRGTSKDSPPQADRIDGAAGATRSVARRALLASPIGRGATTM